jgi:hypothetical protein
VLCNLYGIVLLFWPSYEVYIMLFTCLVAQHKQRSGFAPYGRIGYI